MNQSANDLWHGFDFLGFWPSGFAFRLSARAIITPRVPRKIMKAYAIYRIHWVEWCESFGVIETDDDWEARPSSRHSAKES